MKRVILLAGILLALFSCKKEEQSFCTDAVVTWDGDPSADGFGWCFLADSVNRVYYVPQNLPDSLKINGQPVNVCMYKTKENVSCECALKKYHITFIRKR